MSFSKKIVFILFVLLCTCSVSMAQHDQSATGLQNVFQHVYDTNPTLHAARQELQETKELYPQARSGWLPSLTGEATLYATDVESSNFSGGDGATTKDLTVSLDQPIWSGGATFARVARARDLISAGEAMLKRAEQDVFLDAVRAYVNVLQGRELLILRRKNERLLFKEYVAAKERMNIGEITLTSVEQAKARLHRAEAERIRAQSDLDQAQAVFTEITGMGSPDEMIYPWVSFEFPETLDDMVLKAEESNPQLIMARYEHDAQEHDVDAIFREMFPQISAFASYNKQYDPQPGIVEQSETETIGIRARIALYQGGLTRSRVREARHAVKRQEYVIQELKRRIRQEVISNWRSYQAAKAQTASREIESKAAEAALIGVREESRAGQRTILDILDADLDTINAQVALIRARRNQIIAQFSLAHSLGILGAENLKLQTN